MANQTAANLNTINTIYYAALNPTQVHPFYKRMVYDTYGTNKLFAWLDMNTTRSLRPATTFLHFENDRLTLPITTTGGAYVGGVAFNLTISSGYLNAGAYSPVQAGYKIFDGTNYFTINSVNTAVANAHVMNLTSDVSTIAAGSIASGQLLNILQAQAVIEGSSAGANSLRGQGVQFSNTMQEFRRDYAVTGQALASFDQEVTFFDYTNPETGEPEKIWWHAELDRVHLEFMNAQEEYGITGQAVTTAAVQNTFGLGTTGVIPQIKAYGNTVNYSRVMGFQVNNFQDMSEVMEKNQSSDEWEFWGGIELINEAQNTLKDFFPNGSIMYDSFSGGQSMAMSFGFQSFAAYQRTWHFHNMQIFNRPDFLGAALATGDYIGAAIILPRGKTAGKKGAPVDYIERVTLNGNSVNYGYDHWAVDGTGVFNPTMWRPTTTRQVTFCWATTLGVEGNAMKQLFYAQRTN